MWGCGVRFLVSAWWVLREGGWVVVVAGVVAGVMVVVGFLIVSVVAGVCERRGWL